MLRRLGIGVRQLAVIDRRDLGETDRRAFTRRLDDERQTEFRDDAHPVGLRVDDPVARQGKSQALGVFLQDGLEVTEREVGRIDTGEPGMQCLEPMRCQFPPQADADLWLRLRQI